jgi:hypothetical protein
MKTSKKTIKPAALALVLGVGMSLAAPAAFAQIYQTEYLSTGGTMMCSCPAGSYFEGQTECGYQFPNPEYGKVPNVPVILFGTTPATCEPEIPAPTYPADGYPTECGQECDPGDGNLDDN